MIPFSHILISEFGAICRKQAAPQAVSIINPAFFFSPRSPPPRRLLVKESGLNGEGPIEMVIPTQKNSSRVGPMADPILNGRTQMPAWVIQGVAVVDGCLYTLGADKNRLLCDLLEPQ